VTFEEINATPLRWLAGDGPQSEIVLSCRVRLARNLRGHRFSHHAEIEELEEIQQDVTLGLAGRGTFGDGWSLELEACRPLERRCLLEKHLVSPDLLREPAARSLLLARDLEHAIMVNEEDHLRIQVYRAGFDPLTTCNAALALDAEIEERLDFAFSQELGYLTSCPTNVGTGFRLSALVHLPGLVLGGEIERILNSLRQLHFTVRGLFGEGSAVRGALFQISNLGTLGRSEDNLTTDFLRHVSKVIQYERLAREKLLEKDEPGLADTFHRALAVLQHARLMTTQEAFDRLSSVRMGVSLGLLPEIGMGVLNRALVEMQPAHVQVRAGRLVKGRERAAARADYLRELLAAAT
jgi:protein arginine kinase